jgi:adenylate cyclase
MNRVADAGLPAAHAGIAAGPVVSRDGDVYGHTVLAARLASHAAAGELLVPTDMVKSVAAAGFGYEAAGETSLKGIPDPVSVVRVARAAVSPP